MPLTPAEKQRRYRARRKNNPERDAEFKRKDRERYHINKRLVRDLTTLEHRAIKAKWRSANARRKAGHKQGCRKSDWRFNMAERQCIGSQLIAHGKTISDGTFALKERLADLKEKRRLRCRKLRECCKKKVSVMSACEKSQTRKTWREYLDKSYKKKMLKTDMGNQFIIEVNIRRSSSDDERPVFFKAQPEMIENILQPTTPNPRLAREQ
ncbi:unnamed protein product [Pieris brassicae]|uniref:Uncharacterized protein n=1 Tax=Pieris brassicae TaxID=7116 RepID=A0A9P0X9S2_PIEBR|nr:unnamed protein product [Pieris brassicae]